MRRSVPVFLSHKGAIQFSRPAWVKRWPFPSDHTGSASINTGARAVRWQLVPWSGSFSLWLEARQQELLLNLFTPPSLLVALLVDVVLAPLAAAEAPLEMWLVCSPLKTRTSWKARCLFELASVPAATLPSRRRRRERKRRKKKQLRMPSHSCQTTGKRFVFAPTPISTLCVNSGTWTGGGGGEKGWQYCRSLPSQNCRRWDRNTRLLAEL